MDNKSHKLLKNEWITQEQLKHPICNCGCGEEIIIKFFHKYTGIPRFLFGHNNRGENNGNFNNGDKIQGKKNPMYGVHRFGIKAPHYGKKHSQNTKNKISMGKKELLKNPENNPNWRGGKSFEPYSLEFTRALRKQIRKRDNFTCQKCGKTEKEQVNQLNRVLTIHHIDYNKQNCSPDNLITLCVSCNGKVNQARDWWTGFFMGRIYEKAKQIGL